MSSGNSKDPGSSVSTKEFMDEFDFFLAEKGVKFDNVGPFDWDIVEEFLREKLNSSPPPSLMPRLPPLIPAPLQIPGKDGESQSFVSDMEEFGWFLAEKQELSKYLNTTDWKIVDEVLREKVSLSPPPVIRAPPENLDVEMRSVDEEDSESSDSLKRFMEEFNLTLREEFQNDVSTDWNDIEDIVMEDVSSLPPSSPPSHLSLPDSRMSISSGELIEDADWLPPETRPQFENVAPTDWNMMEESPMEVFLSPPPSLTAFPPPVCLAPPNFTQTNTVVSLGGVQDHMSWPPPPTFPPHASPAMPQLINNPPDLPAGGAHSQGEILNWFSIDNLPENAFLQPFGVLNGQILYSVVPPSQQNVCTSNRKRKRVDDQDDGRPYVKKPPNAFMLFLQEQRPKVVAELNISNSAAVNSIVGERWSSLPEEQKAKYYDQARVERQLHEQQHPDWSSNDNYGRKRKRVRRRISESSSTAYTSTGSVHFSA